MARRVSCWDKPRGHLQDADRRAELGLKLTIPLPLRHANVMAMHRHDATSVAELANRVFGDPRKAAKWLARPSLQLGGRAPRDLLATEDGARRVEELLAQIDDDNRLHSR